MISAIMDGAFEDPPWSRFLDQLRRLTGADFATLLFRPHERPLAEAVHLFSGDIPVPSVDQVYGSHLGGLEALTDLKLEEGRVYAFDELYPPNSSKHSGKFYQEVIAASGITACRMVRVMEPTGVSAWLTISRRMDDFLPADEALLLTIAPIMRGVLRLYVALESARFSASVTGDAMRRLYFAWMTLDARGHLVEYDHEAGRAMTMSGVLSKGANSRLVIEPASLARTILDAIEAIADDPKARPRAFILSQDPWLDMLLVPMTHNRISAHPRAVAIAYVHGDSWHAEDRCEQLTQLFGLSNGEARLALALSRGMSIEEAATALGITVGTSRKRSKAIYAKTGARGLPDLIRIIMRSVIALAPRD
ncbi:helix-turn-helix transcriptional regulator [Sphingobium boeckii]|uniref:DNA-binding CsgD family transcriptional regulator n=1 Tax=Sphingobium boeckii TaxID=1082345 RepID=A0A7W9AI91_9SPHN|nr:helix-turn-helix transcriptional regulator [Sphingobium boeckii]MBB5685959.1 DNA-binding CsgD family transcriptional regulator [Sphingobium boeckii]